MRVLSLLVTLSTVFALASGCVSGGAAGPSSGISGRKIRVTTTIGMIADSVRNVGGDRVEVTALMGPGVDPHLYKASQGDIARLSDADIIFYNGLNLEGKMGDIFVRMAGTGKPTIPVSSAIDPSKLREPPEFQGHYDPHIWFDVSLWSETIPTIVESLAKLDPASRSLFEENARAHQERLKGLHEYCRTQIATIPKPQRVLVTAHDAFGYFGRAYEIEVLGLQGISTVSEFSLKELEHLVDVVSDRKIKAVFVESSISKRSIEALVAGCTARGHRVRIGGTLFSDAMGAEGTPEGTYEGMVRHNVDTIVAALR